MRLQFVLKNILASWLGQFVLFFANLFSRWIFLRILTIEYLGISGLFANILSVLSFVDLGLSASISYYLYEPLANKDEKSIKQIVLCYKKIYTTIGFVVMIVGMCLIPALPYIVGENSIEHLIIIYVMYILNAAISYFNVHKVTLINADQKSYIVTSYTNIVKLAQVFIAIGVLYLTKNYICFYFVQIIATIVTNVLIAKRADKLYPFIKNIDKNMDKGDIWDKIKNNMGSMSIHKLASVIVQGTDNILISVFVNVATVGLYANYFTIISCINEVAKSLFNSMTASIGNYSVLETKDKKLDLFNTLIFLEFWIFGFCGICLFVLLTPFVTLWLGEQYQLSIFVVLVVIINFYIQGMRCVILSFRDAEGLWKQDRYKAILETIINLFVSLIIAKKYGLIGVFLGTTCSLLISCVWLEPLILFKYAFKAPVLRYYLEYIKYFMEVLGAGCITYYLCNNIYFSNIYGVFIAKMLICATIPNIVFLALNIKNIYFKAILCKIKNILSSKMLIKN